MKKEKIFIVGFDNDKMISICNKIVSLNNTITIANKFITDFEFTEDSEPYKYYISEDQLNLDFKNNALLYVVTKRDDEISEGIAIDEYENSDIIFIDTKEFNDIKSEYIKDHLVVWLDSTINKKNMNYLKYQQVIIESNYFINFLKNHDSQIYFAPNEKVDDIAKILLEYIFADSKNKKTIIEENS